MVEMSSFAQRHYDAVAEFKRSVDSAETAYVNAVNQALAILRKAVDE